MKRLFIILSISLGISSNLLAQEELPAVELTPSVLTMLGHGNETATSIHADEWKLKDGTMIYSSLPYANDIIGYNDCTPVFIAIKKGHVTAVAPAPNYETESYWALLEDERFFDHWNGETLQNAEALEVDAVSGATYSSQGVIDTVKATLRAIMKR